MSHKLSRTLLAVVVGALLCSMAFAQQREVVRIGLTPYTMYQIWAAASELGVDEVFGVELRIQNVAQTINGIQLMIRGDLDVTAGTPAEHLPIVQQAPQIHNFSTVGFFMGFFFVGRSGQVVPFEELAAEHGVERAKEMRLQEFAGKSFAIIPQRAPLIADALAQVGLTLDDITLVQFADDQRAASAFIGGSADFYIGSLPQQRRLLTMEGNRYVNAGGSEILGPAGLWYDTMLSTPTFMEERREAALRTLAVWYRLVEIWYQNPDLLAPIAADRLSTLTGGDFSVDEYKIMQTDFDEFLTITHALRGFYNENSPLYWAYPVDYFIEQAIEAGDLGAGVSGGDYFMGSESLFFELLSRPDLLKEIFAPVPQPAPSN